MRRLSACFNEAGPCRHPAARASRPLIGSLALIALLALRRPALPPCLRGFALAQDERVRQFRLPSLSAQPKLRHAALRPIKSSTPPACSVLLRFPETLRLSRNESPGPVFPLSCRSAHLYPPAAGFSVVRFIHFWTDPSARPRLLHNRANNKYGTTAVELAAHPRSTAAIAGPLAPSCGAVGKNLNHRYDTLGLISNQRGSWVLESGRARQ